MFTRTRIVFLAVIAIVSILSLKGQEPQASGGQVGRFQLVQGHFVSVSDGHPIDDKGCFKIDTATGKTWIFRYGQREGKAYSGWQQIGD